MKQSEKPAVGRDRPGQTEWVLVCAGIERQSGLHPGGEAAGQVIGFGHDALIDQVLPDLQGTVAVGAEDHDLLAAFGRQLGGIEGRQRHVNGTVHAGLLQLLVLADIDQHGVAVGGPLAGGGGIDF